MIRSWAMGLFLAATTLPSLGYAEPELYRTTVIVTGKGEKNRQIGFKECFDKILVRVSGDPRLPSRPAAKAFREDAGSLVMSFSYRDRMGGVAIHDEQGTYDRPHDLTCAYDPAKLDSVLNELSSQPWIADRPPIFLLLMIERGGDQAVLTKTSAKGGDMRESFTTGARTLAMEARFPSDGDLDIEGWKLLAKRARDGAALTPLTRYIDGVVPLIGHLVWSDEDLGWVADWTLSEVDHHYHWQVRGVNFDEAFRVGVRGTAQVLSGNGQPQ